MELVYPVFLWVLVYPVLLLVREYHQYDHRAIASAQYLVVMWEMQ